MKILMRIIVTAVALAVAAKVVPGIRTEQWALHGTSAVPDDKAIAVTLIVVAIIFGVVNVVIKRVMGCAVYLLTFGLVAIVFNGALLYLTSYIAYDKMHLPFHVATFLAAVEGGLIVGVASEVTNRVLDHRGSSRRSSSGGSPAVGDDYTPGVITRRIITRGIMTQGAITRGNDPRSQS